jgi:hypothetical protein
MIRRLTGLAVLCLVVVTILVLLKIDPGAGSGALSSPSTKRGCNRPRVRNLFSPIAAGLILTLGRGWPPRS